MKLTREELSILIDAVEYLQQGKLTEEYKKQLNVLVIKLYSEMYP